MRKGFTLIELLAVIVILAIILVIAVPQILGVIENSKKDSLSSSAMLVAKTVEQNMMLDENRLTTIDCMNGYGLNNNDYESCTAKISYGDPDVIVSVDIVGKGKFDGLIVGATTNNAHVIESTNTQSLKTVLLSTVGGKDVDVNKYAGNGLYKWGNKYIYRGGLTKTNPSGTLANNQYTNDVDSGSEVDNYIKVPWEDYSTYLDCTTINNKCYRIIGINEDGSITIVRDRAVSNQAFDNTHNTAASNKFSQPSTHYGYNDLLANTPTEGHPEEYRPYSLMYTYLYGSSGYENTTIKPYSSILQPINICLNKVNDYAGLNNISYTITTRVTDTCNVSGKPNTRIVSPLKNKYVRLPYPEEYLNASLESTCTEDYQYQCRNLNYIYNKQNSHVINTRFADSYHIFDIDINGSLNKDHFAYYTFFGVRPVLVLKSTVLISGGTGTQTSPYVIKW